MNQKHMLKIVAIFLLLISFVGTGFFGVYIKDIFLYLFGFLYYWVSVLLIIFLLVSMTKKRYRKKLNKYIMIFFFACLSIDLLVTLINSSNLLTENFMLNQTLFTSDNVLDKIGLFQGLIVYILFTLFGYAGVYIGAFFLMGIAIILVLDIDLLISKIVNKASKKESKTNKTKINKADKSRVNKAGKTKLDKSKKNKTKNISEYQTNENDKKEKKKEEKSDDKSKGDDFKVSINSSLLKKKEPSEKSKGKEKDKTDEQKNLKEANAQTNSDLFEMRIPIKGRVKSDKSLPKEEVKESSSITSAEIENLGYKIPSIELLDNIATNDKKYEKLKEEALKKKKSLEEALSSFNVKAKVKNITVGSTITKYELQPEAGQKVNKFLSLTNDLAMALEASSTRIEAPIPGKSLVGIEIPNSEKLMVGLKEIINSSKDKTNKLKVALGEDIEGNAKFIEIDKTPHLLIAGATGSGKSVCINSIITGILLQATPDEVKFLLVDPKKVELTPYEGIPHLLAPVITDAQKATIALNKLVLEMERRYELFTETKTRNIVSYNQSKEKEEKLPYIVAIIDELADLMMVASSDIEASISRIAQKARAAGIHLILATQRPSTDVITGLIKSNIPSRISFMVSSSIDSRTILDSKGAESLLGHGDMLLSRAGAAGFERIQGGYLSDEEIQKVVSFITEQIKDEKIDDYYKDDFVKLEEENKETSTNNEDDPLEQEAIQIGIEAERISTSLLQRKMKIGYNRAANIIESLESKGYVTAQEGNKGRKIIMERINAENEED